MIFTATPLSGAFTVDLEKRGDERGFFARAYCSREFEQQGLESHFVQANYSGSSKRGTLRGLHYQIPPAAEVKLVRCIRGSLWDVILDLRNNSPTFGQWYGAELSAENGRAMYVPRGFAHGFITLTDDTEAFYLVSSYYTPELERGVRFDDPFHSISWPLIPTEVSAKDAAWPNIDPKFHALDAMRNIT